MNDTVGRRTPPECQCCRQHRQGPRLSVTAKIRDVARILKHDYGARLARVVVEAGVGDPAGWTDLVSKVGERELHEVDVQLTRVIGELLGLRRLVRDQLGAVTPMTCNGCGARMTGRADRRFCSGTCRQRAHRRNQ